MFHLSPYVTIAPKRMGALGPERAQRGAPHLRELCLFRLARTMTTTINNTCLAGSFSDSLRLARFSSVGVTRVSQVAEPIGASVRVLISDSDRMSAQLIADELMRGRHDIVVVGVSVGSAETIRELEKHQPDIALINAHLEDGHMKGYHVLPYMQTLSPKTASLLLIPSSERDLVVNAFRGGARGVFCRLQPIKLLPKCIRTVHEGQIWADTRNLAYILDFLTTHKPLRLIKSGAGIDRLTPREAEVVRLLADGLTTGDISQKLALTEHTIRNYLSAIYDKLGVSSRVELALYAVAREDLDQPMDDCPCAKPPKKAHRFPTPQRAKSESTA